MPDSGHPNSIASLELAFLRALCASEDIRALFEEISPALRSLKWQDPDHAIVYDTLSKVPARDRRPLREQLPAIATRMGFPDMDWGNYFVAGAVEVPAREILEIARKLAAAASRR
jgi:hypothetical protein